MESCACASPTSKATSARTPIRSRVFAVAAAAEPAAAAPPPSASPSPPPEVAGPHEIAPVGSSCPDLGRAHPSSQADYTAAAQYLIAQVLCSPTTWRRSTPAPTTRRVSWAAWPLLLRRRHEPQLRQGVDLVADGDCAAPYAPPAARRRAAARGAPQPPCRRPAAMSRHDQHADLDPQRWCGDLNNQKTGCGAYYSMGASGLVRFY